MKYAVLGENLLSPFLHLSIVNHGAKIQENRYQGFSQGRPNQIPKRILPQGSFKKEEGGKHMKGLLYQFLMSVYFPMSLSAIGITFYIWLGIRKKRLRGKN